MRFMSVIVVGLSLAACESPTEQPVEPVEPAEPVVAAEEMPQPEAQAAVNLEPQNNSSVRGSVAFVEQEGSVQMVTALTGIPSEPLVLTLHEGSSCDSPGAIFDMVRPAAGAPEGEVQAEREMDEMLGYLGEVEGDNGGIANATLEKEDLTLEGTNGVVGKVVALHMPPEEAEGIAAGDEQQLGQLVACGVIREGGTTQPAGQAPAGEDFRGAKP